LFFDSFPYAEASRRLERDCAEATEWFNLRSIFVRNIDRSPKGFLQVTEKDRKLFQPFQKESNPVFWSDSLYKVTGNKRLFPYSLIIKLPVGHGSTYGALIINLDNNRVQNMLKELAIEERGVSLLLKEDGDFISSDNKNITDPSSFDFVLRRKVMDSAAAAKDNKGNIFNWNGEKYSYSYGDFIRLGTRWIYTSASPVSELTSPVLMLSRIIITTSLIMLSLAILLSWVASRQLYRPVYKLMNNNLLNNQNATKTLFNNDEFHYIESSLKALTKQSETLQERVNQQLPTLREGFLLQLVQGHFNYLPEETIKERMKQYGWEVEGKSYGLLLIQPFGVFKTGSFTNGDEQLVTFALANIIEEVSKGWSDQMDVINFQDQTIGVMCSFSDGHSRDTMKSHLTHFSNKIIPVIKEVLQINVTVSISKTISSIREIPDALEESRNALRFRDLKIESEIIDLETLSSGKGELNYPFAIEKEIIQTMKMGLEQKTFSLIEDFLKELQNHAGKEFYVNQGMMQLLGNVQFSILKDGYHLHKLFNDENLYLQLMELREPEKMTSWFKDKVIHPFIKELEQTQNLQIKRLIENVIQILEQDYMKDISLDAIAELNGTYPQKLSIAFKQVTGVNFVTYLTNLRIEKSKQWLRETDEKINDIAEKIGYQPSYFNRIFKKNEGITPGQYRERYRYEF
jgi:AraC-like DNA-binding protein